MRHLGKVLVVDDDPNILELVKLYGEKEGFEIIGVNDGDLVLAAFSKENPDVVIMDIMLPGKDGLTLCGLLRDIRMVPIIMLTAKGEEADRVLGLEMGADDYVSKPFSPRELVARIKAVLRRTKTPDILANCNLKYPELEIVTDTRKVLVTDIEVALTPKEFDLLVFLAQNPLRVFLEIIFYLLFGDMITLVISVQLMYIFVD